jgi:hypothetical protein
MSTDVKAAFVSAVLTVTPNLARIRGFTIASQAAAMAEVFFRDGTTAAAAGGNSFRVAIAPGEQCDMPLTPLGVRMMNGLFVSCPTSVAATVFFDGG